MGNICSAQQSDVKGTTAQNGEAELSDAKVRTRNLLQQLQTLTPLIGETIIKGKKCIVICSAKDEKYLEFAVRLNVGPHTFLMAELSDAQLMQHPRLMNVKWTNFFDSLRNAFSKNLLLGELSGGTLALQVPVETDNASRSVNFQISLKLMPNESIARMCLSPLLGFHTHQLTLPSESETFVPQEQSTAGIKLRITSAQIDLAARQAEIEALRTQCQSANGQSKMAKSKCDQLNTLVNRITDPKGSGDYLYGARDGPQRYPLHTPHCRGHTPVQIPHSKAAIGLIVHQFQDVHFATKSVAPPRAVIPKQITDPDVRQLLDSTPDDVHESIFQTLQKIDDWDFDVFSLQEQAQGGSLFMVTACLMYKYGLVSHFNISHEVLVNWCLAAQSGYHPNPYHNSTHAADVTQVLHFILYPGGMCKAINISPEDALASIISGCIHDFDHPGFNNNFHVRTNAYLSTLYNDRSVLENHHCASTFELMKNPKFDLLQSLTAEQRKDCRDTIMELVLATDMGNHAKIFQTFRKRLQDEAEWTRKEDVRLALSIAIKMADISNCGRPRDLYLEWSKKIAEEFYSQGDVERKLHFTVSPFMDRTKHKADFPKGQMSFMNYIVIPLFEAGAEFVADLDWTVGMIQKNKEYWQHQAEDTSTQR